ncbi:MAG: helix-turn-helix domain-containing protein [Novosphingobium sp.]|uniref:helix-turn-helix domain-containing protein n=1 Tax=Novosphingobium sp. TaxID=1874826 RepID=UPI0032BBD99A
MTLAWNPELLAHRSTFCGEFEHRCLDCGRPIARRGILPETAIGAALRVFEVSLEELRSDHRHADLVEARAFVVWALRSLGRPRSYARIGETIGRDQSSVNHLHRKAIELRLINDDFDAACRGLGQRWLEVGGTRHARCS